jgi:sugar phosphate isomerase/epimerase
MTEQRMPIGVFASAGAGLGAAIEKVTSLGISSVQIHAPGRGARTRENAREVARSFADAGISISLCFIGYRGDSYSSIQAVRETVGLVPTATRSERLQDTWEMCDFASYVGAPGIGIHLGFVSEDPESDEFAAFAEVVGQVADYCADLDMTMNLETGQETADALLHLLKSVDRPNLFVNFDPANMILYGSGEPLEALRKVGAYVRSCHCKDATWSEQPGETWGAEVPLGEGAVNIRKFVRTLKDLGSKGPLTIEREVSGERQIADIRKGIELLRTIKKELGVQ